VSENDLGLPEDHEPTEEEWLDALKRTSRENSASIGSPNLSFNSYRINHPCWLPKLEFVDLENADLRGINFTGVNLSGINLQGANLNGAIFNSACLVNANLEKARLKSASLEAADLRDADLRDTDLERGILQHAQLVEANLKGAKLTWANLQFAVLGHTNLQDTDLKQAQLQYANLSGANLSNAKLCRANLQQAILMEAKLNGADLLRTNLNGANFKLADLSGAKLSMADIRGANFRDTTIKGTLFVDAIVDGETRFRECSFNADTDFSGVGLAGARLEPGLRQALEYNIRRGRWEEWYKKHLFWCLFFWLFWWLSDYGRSGKRLIMGFCLFSFLFASIYFYWGDYEYSKCGVRDCPGFVEGLFVKDGNEVRPDIVPLRAVYFSVVTMTTLGFGDMYAMAGSWWGHILLMIQVLLGYVLLGALVTRFAIMFQEEGPRIDRRRKK